MNTINKIAEQMKADWNRRLKHDYRFWISDGYNSDQDMWDTGERDYNLILKNISDKSSKTILEIGCGVGRLLRPALNEYKKVIGVDVSDEAIVKAKELLNNYSNLQLIVGNGVDLREVDSNSVDIVFSFASLTSIPTDVIAIYICEMNRILTVGGEVRLQLYTGKPQAVGSSDTLHLRCFEEQNLINAFSKAGFSISEINKLDLPTEASIPELNIVATIASFKKQSACTVDSSEISKALLPEGEQETSVNELESWMSINYAKRLMAFGDYEKAEEALQHALAVSSTVATDVGDLLERIKSKLKCEEDNKEDYFNKNIECLRTYFPEVAEKIVTSIIGVTVSYTEEGPCVTERGQVLDHITKPKTSAKTWATRSLADPKYTKADHLVVYGFGTGYHLEELLKIANRPISVVEPSVEAFSMALRIKDLTQVLPNLKGLYLGNEAPKTINSKTAEILIRPQTQTLYPESCVSWKESLYGNRGIGTLRPSIAVLGPLQGGTLPMTNYCSRAFHGLGQRIRPLDMSGFAAGYHNAGSFARDEIRKVGLQNSYLEFVSKVILETANEKPFDILVCMAQAPVSAAVLTELRKRGVITVLWFVEDYLRFTYWQQFSQLFDYVFTIQTGDCLDKIKKAGAGEVHYLPCAADPGIHTPMALSQEEKERWGSPISFVGAGYYNRVMTFASFSGLPFKIWGTEWPEAKPFDRMVQEQGRRLAPEEYTKIFNSTDININLHSSTERDGVDPFGDFINPRTFELAAAGAFQLVDERTLLPELFKAGEEVATFKTTSELKDKINYYLTRPEERIAMTNKARARVLREHTYVHRMEQMLKIIYRSKYQQLAAKEVNQPWTKLLNRSKIDPELNERCKKAYENGDDPRLEGLISGITQGEGKLTETEQKLLFLYHIKKQMIIMRHEENGG